MERGKKQVSEEIHNALALSVHQSFKLNELFNELLLIWVNHINNVTVDFDLKD